MIAIPAAIAHTGIAWRVRKPVGKLSASVLLAGQTAMHSRHPVHSAERICTSLSTGRAEGHALAHLAQSIHVSRLRVIRAGLNKDASPSKLHTDTGNGTRSSARRWTQ